MIRLLSVILVLCLLISVSRFFLFTDDFVEFGSIFVRFPKPKLNFFSLNFLLKNQFFLFLSLKKNSQKNQTGYSIDSVDNDYDCDVPPPLNVEPFTCCKVSKPFDHTNFPECFAPPTPKIFISSSTLSPIPVSEDFHDDYTLSPTRSSIFKKKFKPSRYQTSTNRPIWPSYHHDDSSSSGGGAGTIGDGGYNDGHDYDKNNKYHYYHHHGGSGSDGSGGSGIGSSGYRHWPGKYQHWNYDNNQRQFYGGYRHPYGRHRRNAPIYHHSAPTSNVSLTNAN